MRLSDLTTLERAALSAIVFSDYQDSDQIAEVLNNPVWTPAESHSDGGVYASLLKKGLIGVDNAGPRNDHQVWVTQAARPLVTALLAGTA